MSKKKDHYFSFYFNFFYRMGNIENPNALKLLFLLGEKLLINSNQVAAPHHDRRKLAEELGIQVKNLNELLETLKSEKFLSVSEDKIYLDPKLFWKGEKGPRLSYLIKKNVRKVYSQKGLGAGLRFYRNSC